MQIIGPAPAIMYECILTRSLLLTELFSRARSSWKASTGLKQCNWTISSPEESLLRQRFFPKLRNKGETSLHQCSAVFNDSSVLHRPLTLADHRYLEA